MVAKKRQRARVSAREALAAKGIMTDWYAREQLHFAASDGEIEKVKILLQQGADPNLFDDLGKTALIYAAEKNHIEIVKALLAAGADVNAHDEGKAGNTALGEIAATCSYAMAKALIEAGADPTIPGWMQVTALDRTAARKRGDGHRVHELLLTAAHNKRLKP